LIDQAVRFIAPGAKVASDFSHADTSHDGRTIDEVFQRIEEGPVLGLRFTTSRPF
jgi:hypothetical protein